MIKTMRFGKPIMLTLVVVLLAAAAAAVYESVHPLIAAPRQA